MQTKNQVNETPDPTKLCAITNEGSSSVVVLTPTTAQPNGGSNSASVYDQALEILTIAEGGDVIAPGKKGTITLNQYYADPTTGKQTYSLVYDLLVSTSDWLFPVANIGIMQNIFSKPVGFTPQTVTKAEEQAMKDAAAFCQVIAAYPTSELAQQYQAAMSSTQTGATTQANGSANSSTNVANSITDGVNKFFQSTKGYKDVTLASVVAVNSYYNEFPFVWAQYKSTSYYLYGSIAGATNFLGVLTLTKPAAIDVSKPNGGYACTFAAASNPSDTTTVNVNTTGAKQLTYSDGLFVDNVNLDLPGVAVKSTFQLKQLFTQKAGDTDIIPVITGTVNGVVCLGFDSPQLSTDTSSGFWDTLFHPKTSAGIFNSIMEIGGAIMMLHFFATTLYGIGKWAKNLGNAKEPTTAELLKNQQDALEKSMTEKIDAAVKKMSGGKEEAPANPEDANKEAASEESEVGNEIGKGKEEAALEEEAGNLEAEAELMGDMNAGQVNALEANAGEIQQAEDKLDAAAPEELGSVVKAEAVELSNIEAGDVALENAVASNEAASEKAEIEANEAASKTVSEEVTEASKEAEEEVSSDDPAGEPIEPDAAV